MPGEFRTAIFLALRHHPLCVHFDADRFGPFCSGCVMFWPAWLVTFPVMLRVVLEHQVAWPVLAASIALGVPQLLGLVIRFSRPVRAAIKAMGGAAVAGASAAILLLPVPWPWRAGLFVAMLLAFVCITAVRARSILRTCDACPWQRDWARCPGFRIQSD